VSRGDLAREAAWIRALQFDAQQVRGFPADVHRKVRVELAEPPSNH